MAINHWVRALLIVAALLTAPKVLAQQPHCKDSAEHIRLREAMWASCQQDSQQVVYDACMAYLAHAKEDGDMLEAGSSWVCGIMYSLGKMNISSAYHIAQGLKADIMSGPYAEEGQYFISNMMGHVYNTCGNIPGAEAEFLKSAEQIKGTSFEVDGLAFIYLAIAHVHLNNSLKQTLHWLDVTEEELEKNKGSWNYYRCLADVYAIRAIVRFKQKNFDAFRQCIAKMDEAEKMNKVPSGDLFTPYARIYQTLLEKGSTQALAEADSLNNLKEQYLLKCDIYRYIGADDKAFLTQRELMHKRDSITGLMIAENIDRVEEEMELMRRSHKMGRLMNYVLVGAMVLLILAIILLHRNILIRRKFSKRLIAKNEELRAAYKHVAAADEMKTEFIRNVSHEIRTPLNIINGFTQVLADQGSDMGDTERKAISNTIGNSTRQITSLVNKMLALANDSTKDLLSEVDMTDGLEICQKAIADMPDVDPNRIKVSLDDQTGGDKMLYTHGDSLLQMLGNILENSVKFTEEGHIILKVRTEKEKNRKMMFFTVEDTGCGIPSDKVGTIFQRWVKADEFKEGLGLGLAYCWETAQKLGGSLRLVETSEKGTTFELGLPVERVKN
jgi:signal transduction histidine kinase